jgi:hypothetical protein
MPMFKQFEIFDVEEDGFPKPEDLGVGFYWDSGVYTGWPLIDWDNSYENRNFATPEQATNGPLNVRWEASEDRVSGLFTEVRYWFRIPNPAED